MAQLAKIATLSILVASLATCDIVLRPKGFIKLPDQKGALSLNLGTADKAAYDDLHNILYVIGHKADVLNVIDMRNSLTEPTLARTITFDYLNQGYPNDIKLCRSENLMTREFLAISFESRDLSERGHVHFYQPLANPLDVLVRLKTVTAVEGFDPRSISWNRACSELVVTSRGVPHMINGQFEDPKPALDLLVPTFGLNVDRATRPFSEASVKTADVRKVFTSCDSGTFQGYSSHVQDLEATHVVVDDDDTAYVLFQTNNAIGRLNLRNPLSPMEFHNLGLKDWSQLGIDTAYEDGGIKLNSHVMMSMYQPGHAVTFTLGNKTFLATADGGDIRSYSYRSGNTYLCTFAESALGRNWREDFSGFMSPSISTSLKANLSNYASTGRMSFSRIRSIQDGYNPLQLGFNYLTTYGGRGWSMYDVTNMARVYESGDLMERHFLSADIKDEEKAMFNDYYLSPTTAQSQYVDRTSPAFGPKPTAVATGNINDTRVVVVANGYVGGLYVFTVDDNSTDNSPNVVFQGFQRRGSPGLTWAESYKKDDDSVGEPGITDLLWINDEGESVVVAISSIAGAASFYSVEVTP